MEYLLIKSALNTMTSYESDTYKLREFENKVSVRFFVPKRGVKFTCFTLRKMYNNNNNNNT